MVAGGDIEMYPSHNEGKSVAAERFIRTLKNKIYKYMTSVSDVDDIVSKYNYTYHSTIKLMPIDVKPNTYIDFSKEDNEKDPKFEVADHVRISKYKNIFARVYTQKWSEEDFMIKKVKNNVPWTYVISDLNGEEDAGRFTKKN